jgi:hypothetical protein
LALSIAWFLLASVNGTDAAVATLGTETTVHNETGVVAKCPDVHAPAKHTETLEEAIRCGEFPLVQAELSKVPAEQADLLRQKMALRQLETGASQAAWQSARQVQNPQILANTLDTMRQQQQDYWSQQYGTGAGGQGTGFGNPTGTPIGSSGRSNSAGGITIGDFQPLIDLIQSNIEPDSWADANGDGTIQPWLGGVSVDAQGTLRRIRTDATGELSTIRRRMADRNRQSHQVPESELRTVSLLELERQARWLTAQGRPLSAEITNMAGLYEIRYVVLAPDNNDLWLVGPAGPWHWSPDGRAVNSLTGKPVLQLDDFVVCLRNAFFNQGKFGCSIDPRADNLRQTQELINDGLAKQSGWQKKLRDSLGLQDISIFGIPGNSHAASVIVEADYRMKLVGMGLESSIPEIPSYLERVSTLPDGTLPPMEIARWWFTLDYDSLVADSDRTVFAFTGSGVRVLSENERLNAQGQRQALGTARGPTLGFAQDFTRNFDKIAAKYPIYQQLKGVFDMALVSALIQQENLHHRAGWSMDYFLGNSATQRGVVYPLRQNYVPQQVDSVMNTRVFQARSNGKTLRHTLVGVSGGVQCDFGELLRSQPLRTDPTLVRPALAQVNAAESNPAEQISPSPAWWWD